MILENWFLEKTRNNFRLVGNVYGDDKKRFEDGQLINTSSLESIDFKNKIAKTKNSIYKLGERN